ncbi:hypothetical protein BCR32DRAFT_287805 [Anaeromyces robustus]|uniref:Uncharacterized protein n=1 Tax=Anaeromyces robustus TaxID=1754192 RepID=A0A1Y1VQR4_9FUNG|nr:hypothetical protein BCR32DRAFT_287805 [Anaeromyces robustus]|eukprot:ORX63376.1 hypothetical protein BCR32DRAFT_287805 [Anaeromyces robustus]
MNFKTILSVFCLGIATISASPINEVADIKKSCENYYQYHGYYFTNSEFRYNQAKFYTNELTGEYTCLRPIYTETVVDDRICYLFNNDFTCIEEGFNNIPNCSKKSDAADYVKCAYKIVGMMDDGSNKLTYRIRKFPTKEKIFDDSDVDQKECRGFNGTVLSYKDSSKYICLEPVTPKNAMTLSNKECVKLDGKVHCVVEDNTSIETCIKDGKNYNHEACTSTLKEYGNFNHHAITELY